MSTTSARLAGSAVLAVGLSLALVAPAGALEEGAQVGEAVDPTASTEQSTAPQDSEPGAAESVGTPAAAPPDSLVDSAPVAAADAHDQEPIVDQPVEPISDEAAAALGTTDGGNAGRADGGTAGAGDGALDGDADGFADGYDDGSADGSFTPQTASATAPPAASACSGSNPDSLPAGIEEGSSAATAYREAYRDAYDVTCESAYAESYEGAYPGAYAAAYLEGGAEGVLAWQEQNPTPDPAPPPTPTPTPDPGTGGGDDLGRPSNPSADAGLGQVAQRSAQSGLGRQRTPAVRAESTPAAERVRVQRTSVAASAPAQLPRTGSDAGEIAFLGTVLVGGGVVLLTASRPRRRAAHRA